MLTKEDAAARLDGNEYAKEGSKELWAEMKAAGLVAVFGAGVDLMELRGAVYEEIGAYEGAAAYFTRAGLIDLTNKCGNDYCPYHTAIRERAEASAAAVEALWDPGDGSSWHIKTDIPHVAFKVMEDGEVYCRGLVFALADAPDRLPA